jgi:hypothetical protein
MPSGILSPAPIKRDLRTVRLYLDKAKIHIHRGGSGFDERRNQVPLIARQPIVAARSGLLFLWIPLWDAYHAAVHEFRDLFCAVADLAKHRL